MALKRIIGLLLSVLLLGLTGAVGLSADQQNATITTTVPGSFQVMISCDANGDVLTGDGGLISNGVFTVPRGAAQSYIFRAKSGFKLASVTYNGQNVTSQVSGGTWTAPAITSDSALSVSFVKDTNVSSASSSAPSSSSSTTPSSGSSENRTVFTLIGKVSVNGNPLANAVLELTGDFGTLTAKSDANGNYRFDNVPAGPYSLTVTSGGGLIGSAEFNLNESNSTELKAETDEKGITRITVGKEIKVLEINFAVKNNGKIEISAQLPPEGQQVPYTGVQTDGYLVPVSVICALSVLVLAVIGKRKQREK